MKEYKGGCIQELHKPNYENMGTKMLPHYLLHEASDGSIVKNASENFYCIYDKGKIWTPSQSYVLPSCVPSTSCGCKSFVNTYCKCFSCVLPCVLSKLPAVKNTVFTYIKFVSYK